MLSSGNHEGYANKACWVSSTYYLPHDSRIPLEGERREWINYYQWLPMILLLQASLFYAPVLVWRGFSGKIGVHIHNIVESGRKLHDGEMKEKHLGYMVQQIDRYLSHYRDDRQGCCYKLKQLARRCNILCGKKYGNFLVILYFMCKLLYLSNCLGQLFLMDLFLGTDYHFYGFHAMKTIIMGDEWPGSSRFPTFTICDYKVRQMGHNIHRNTLQCVLPINFFNDKLYLVLWVCYFLIAVATGINLVIWIIRIFAPTDGVRFVKRHLRSMQRITSDEKKYSQRFIRDYLRPDGVMIVRLVQMNCSDIVASELTAELYDYYKNNPPTASKKHEDTEDEESSQMV